MAATTTPETPDAREARELVERAVKLPVPIREGVALAILHSIDPPPNSDADWEYWKAEIQRRIEAVERGEMKTYTLEETLEHMQKALDEGRRS